LQNGKTDTCLNDVNIQKRYNAAVHVHCVFVAIRAKTKHSFELHTLENQRTARLSYYSCAFVCAIINMDYYGLKLIVALRSVHRY